MAIHTTPAPYAPAAHNIVQNDLDQARAAGHTAGTTAERERIHAILGHANAAANMPLALACINIGMPAQQASAVLASAPAAAIASAAPVNQFAALMVGLTNPSGVKH